MKINEKDLEANTNNPETLSIKERTDKKKNNNGKFNTDGIQSDVEIEKDKKKQSSDNNIKDVNSNNKTQEINNIKEKEKEESNSCFQNFFLFMVSMILILVVLLSIFNIILEIGLMVSEQKNKECKAKIYTKMKVILILYLCLLILSNVSECILKIEKIKECCGGCLFFIFLLLLKFSAFGIALVNVIITQEYFIYYDNWEKCGSVKGWTLCSLIYNYIVTFFNFLQLIILFFICGL